MTTLVFAIIMICLVIIAVTAIHIMFQYLKLRDTLKKLDEKDRDA